MKGRVQPSVPAKAAADFLRRLAGSRARPFDFADMEWVAHYGTAGRLHCLRQQVRRVARQNGGKGCGDGDSRFPQGPERSPSISDGGTVWFEDTADIFAIRGDGKADPQAGARGRQPEQVQIPQDERPSGLDYESLRWARRDNNCRKDGPHQACGLFCRLIRVGQG